MNHNISFTLWGLMGVMTIGLTACSDPAPAPLCVDDASCADLNSCTVDTCDPAVGCVSTPDAAACDDGLPCTVDTCDLAVGCINTADDGVCDDAVACTVDTCDVIQGCVLTPATERCDDGNLCTADICEPTTGCIQTAGALDCDDGIPCTVDTCDPLDGCINTPDAGACVAAVGCLQVACVAGQGCVSSTDDLECDDSDACTADACDDAGACSHSPLSAGDCDDADPCTTADGCAAGVCRGALLDGCFYVEDPDLPSCSPGLLSPGRKLQAMDDVNTIRALSGLPAVGYGWAGDVATQAASLIMVANSQLTHAPLSTAICWTEEGADGAITSNLQLFWQWEPEHQLPWASITAFLIDNGVTSLGHRRWILDPFLAQVSYGAVHGPAQIASATYPYAFSASLQVIHEEQADISGTDIDFVAYPVGEYPKELFLPQWFLSFSWLLDKEERYPNSLVNYDDLLVTVTDPGGAPMPVLDVSANTDWFGLPNHVQWRVDGLVEGAEYTVTVEGAVSGETPLSTTYTFTLL